MPGFEFSYRAALARFAADRRGNVAMMFAIVLFPLLMIVGGGFDYTASLRLRAGVDTAADAAALAAARTAAERYRNGGTDWSTVGSSAGVSAFGANVSSGLKGLTVGAPTVNVTKNGQSITATVNYSGTMATNFLRLANIPTIRIGNNVSSTVMVATYTDLHIVIDISTSMGMAATTADQAKILTVLGTDCYVACHINAFAGSDNVASYRSAGAVLRIDVVKSSIVSAINTLRAASAAGTIRVGVYTFHNTLSQVFAPSTDLTAAIAAVNSVDLTTEGGGTNVTYALQTLNGMLATAGSGMNASSPKGAVLLFTDGTQDRASYYSSTLWSPDPNWTTASPAVFNGWDMQTIDPSSCSPIKSKGYSFLVLNTNYVISPSDLTKDSRYVDINNTLIPVLHSNVIACSSGASYAFSANSPTEINAAVQTMFSSAANTLSRLTN